MSTSAKRFGELPLEVKFLAGFGLALGILLAAAVVQYRTIQALVETDRWVGHTHAVLAELEGTVSSLGSMESDARGYVATADISFISQEEVWSSRAGDHLRRLQVLTADNPSQQRTLGRVGRLVGQRLAYMHRLIALRSEQGLAPATQLMATGEGRRLTSEIRALIAAMEAKENGLLEARQAASGATARRAMGVAALGSLLALVPVVMAGWIIHTDVVARAQAEAALRRASAYNRSLIEASLDPLVTIAPDGKITDVNSATEKVTGHTRDELIGTDFSDYFTDSDKARAGYQQVFREGHVHNYELEIRHRNGQTIPVVYNASVYRDEAGEVIGVFAAARDITERKRAEEEIRKLNAELEQRVRQRTAELEAANKELEAFTYSVSHDLRAPLRHIDGFSRLLQEEHGQALAVEAQQYVATIREATLQMGALIDDLLNLTRVGRRPLSVQVTGLNSLVEEIQRGLNREAAGRKVEWRVGKLPFVECDPNLMKQVFANLLSNAVKFTRPRDPAIIEIGAEQQNGYPGIFVRDNGVGFSMKYVDKLFGVFQRLHRAEDFEGTGVGLATVQRIIHKHGGRVWAEGELDQGATFHFTLGVVEGVQPDRTDGSGG